MQNLETFGCKHGLVAAVLFHSEHVALDFRRPSAEVEAVRQRGEMKTGTLRPQRKRAEERKLK